MARRYKKEKLDPEIDDDTMPENVEALKNAVVGHKIVSVEKTKASKNYWGTSESTTLTLDDGTTVELLDTNDCCAFTELREFLLHPDKVDHIITGVGTTDGFDTWHIYADFGDVLELTVGWSSGNPFYYGYGFDIRVKKPDVSS